MSKRKEDSTETESQKKSKQDFDAPIGLGAVDKQSKASNPENATSPNKAAGGSTDKTTSSTNPDNATSTNAPPPAFSSASSTANATWKENSLLKICEGVTLKWSNQNETTCLVELTTNGSNTKLGQYDRNWFTLTSGYLVLSNTQDESPPLFCRKFHDDINGSIKGGSSYSGGSSGGVLTIDFAKKVKGTRVVAMFESQMNSNQQKEYDLNVEKAKQHPLAFLAFLNQDEDHHFHIERVDMTNKASYCDLTLETSGGSIFRMKARLGGIHISEQDMVQMIQENPCPNIIEMSMLLHPSPIFRRM